MVNFEVFVSSVRALLQTSTNYGSPPFSSFSNRNLISMVNGFLNNLMKSNTAKILQNIFIETFWLICD